MEPRPATTGHPDVDAALEAVAGLQSRPIDEHLPAFESAHRLLAGALTDVSRPPD